MKHASILQICIVLALVGYIAYKSLLTPADIHLQRHTDQAPKEQSEEVLARGAIQTNLGNWTPATLLEVIQKSKNLSDIGKQVNAISENFLGTPYEGNTLIGDAETPEKLTVHLAGLDCFTYIDYVEAVRQSDSYETFLDTLQNTRYKSGIVGFQHRNHFFSDWTEYNKDKVSDVTKEIGGDTAIDVEKQLNQKKDGTVFLKGIPIVSRTITYIPSGAITNEIIKNIRTGDYIGIYTDIKGLDITHTGIFIRNDSGTYLRHASSREEAQQVIDDDFLTYIKNKPGILIYRPQ